MCPKINNFTLEDELLRRFRAFIQNSCGLYFKDHNLKDVTLAVRDRMRVRNTDSAENYYELLTTAPDYENEFREFLNLLTIKHTYFFRNRAHFDALRDNILPGMIEKKRRLAEQSSERPRLNIWSAGSSTGEEPYTIAIILHEIIPDIEEWDILLSATDVSSSAIEQARKGVFRKSSLQQVEPDHLEKYFQPIDGSSSGEHILSAKIRNTVTFDYFNLMEPRYPGPFDIIFCRNVLIYFDLPVIIQVLDNFYSSLISEGYLFIGYSESLQYISDKFEMNQISDGIVYRKLSRPSGVQSVQKEKPPAKKMEEVIDEISRAELESVTAATAVNANEDQRPLEELRIDIMKHVQLKEYEPALKMIRHALSGEEKPLDLLYMSAEIYLNQGNMDSARKDLQEILRRDSFHAPAHYLLATLATEEGHFDQARTSLKKSLYINNQFPLASFSLAMIYKQQGLVPEAIREYRNTLKILSGLDQQSVLAYSGGIVVNALASVCTDNIERLKYVFD